MYVRNVRDEIDDIYCYILYVGTRVHTRPVYIYILGAQYIYWSSMHTGPNIYTYKLLSISPTVSLLVALLVPGGALPIC